MVASIAETSPEQRGSEVHTKKTVMIKTIETRDGEVSHLSGPLTHGGRQGAMGYVCEAVSQVLSTGCSGSSLTQMETGSCWSWGAAQDWGSILLPALVCTGLLFFPRSSVRPHSSNTRCSKARDPSAIRDHPRPCPHCLLKPASLRPRSPHPATVLPSQPLTPAHRPLLMAPPGDTAHPCPGTGSPSRVSPGCWK